MSYESPSYKHLFLAGMCLQAFVEAFFCLAQKKYKSLPLHQQVTLLVDFCEYQLAVLDEKRRAVCHADGPHLTPAAHPSLLGRSASASKLSDYRNHR